MKQYDKLYYYKPELMGEQVWAFDKLDGQSMRFEANFNRGFYKFGSRTQMVSSKDEQFGAAVDMFMEKYSENLMYTFGRKYNQDRTAKFTVFCEYVGPNSFAGRHVPGETKDLVLFDVWIYKKGWVKPQKFIDNFGHLDIPNLVYQGELTDEFILDIQESKGPTEVNFCLIKGHSLALVHRNSPCKLKWQLAQLCFYFTIFFYTPGICGDRHLFTTGKLYDWASVFIKINHNTHRPIHILSFCIIFDTNNFGTFFQ